MVWWSFAITSASTCFDVKTILFLVTKQAQSFYSVYRSFLKDLIQVAKVNVCDDAAENEFWETSLPPFATQMPLGLCYSVARCFGKATSFVKQELHYVTGLVSNFKDYWYASVAVDHRKSIDKVHSCRQRSTDGPFVQREQSRCRNTHFWKCNALPQPGVTNSWLLTGKMKDTHLVSEVLRPNSVVKASVLRWFLDMVGPHIDCCPTNS